MKTAKHLPLSLEAQAALEVLALPTQEKCDMLQPSQAKLSQASLLGSLGLYAALDSIFHLYFLGLLSQILKSGSMSASVWRQSFGCGKLQQKVLHMHFHSNSCSHGPDRVISVCYFGLPRSFLANLNHLLDHSGFHNWNQGLLLFHWLAQVCKFWFLE